MVAVRIAYGIADDLIFRAGAKVERLSTQDNFLAQQAIDCQKGNRLISFLTDRSIVRCQADLGAASARQKRIGLDLRTKVIGHFLNEGRYPLCGDISGLDPDLDGFAQPLEIFL